MTGFGVAEGDVEGRRLRVEVRTVNHRHLHLTVRLPADLAEHEAVVRDAVKQGFERGHVTVVGEWFDGSRSAVARIDWDQAAGAVEALRTLRERFALAGDVTLDQVVRFPDVLGSGRETGAVPWSAMEGVVTAALGQCTLARRREGAALADEITGRLAAIERLATAVAAALPGRLQREMGRLRLAVSELAGGIDVDPGRLAQEIAFLADRMDVTEELVRLRAHLAAGREALGADRPVGKQLGFLAQEIGREVNTVGSKANDAAIAHEVIAMKGELEKVREQVENLE
jgi:uncharacterized protein (TIGR00255 family)